VNTYNALTLREFSKQIRLQITPQKSAQNTQSFNSSAQSGRFLNEIQAVL